MSIFAEAAVELGDRDACSALYDHLAPYGDLHCASGPIYYESADSVVGNLAAFLGNAEEAEQRLHHALAVHREIGAAYWTARTAVDLAQRLLGSGSASDRKTEMTKLLDRRGSPG